MTRVLLSCLQSQKRHPLPAYDFWRSHFVEGCREAGIECVEVPGIDWAEGCVYPKGEDLDTWRTRTWETVLSFVRTEHAKRPINFFLGYLYPNQVEVSAIKDLQQAGIPCVNFFCDNVREFRQVPAEYRPFALHWVPEFEALPMYKKAGLPHLHAPMPCWVPPELRTIPAAESEPPMFIGSADVLRRNLLGRALEIGADFYIRGPGWALDADTSTGVSKQQRTTIRIIANQIAGWQQHGLRGMYHKLGNRLHPLRTPVIPRARILPFVSNEDYLRITRDAMVAIGVNRVSSIYASDRHPLTYSRLRDIQAPMLGACYLTEWTKGLSQLYELGSEIETYRTPEELSAKIDELKNDPNRRKLMRRRAQKRALSEHSASQSLRLIHAHLGLDRSRMRTHLTANDQSKV